MLVVDDDEDLRRMVRDVLEHLGHSVVMAGNGEEALAALDAASEAFDLVLTDLTMPVLDGAGLVRALRERPDAPRIVLLAGASDDAEERGLTPESLDGRLDKPVRMDDLAALMDALFP